LWRRLVKYGVSAGFSLQGAVVEIHRLGCKYRSDMVLNGAEDRLANHLALPLALFDVDGAVVDIISSIINYLQRWLS
jgi:hypothetical protein